MLSGSAAHRSATTPRSTPRPALLLRRVSIEQALKESVRQLTKNNNGYPATPAMAARVANQVWSLTEIAALLD